LFRIESETGEVVARLSVGEAEFWLADESPEHFNFSPESLGGGTVRMVFTVDDPDAMFAQAVAAGAVVVTPVANQYGWCPGPHLRSLRAHWEIGKPLS
jgi:PhnB protein